MGARGDCEVVEVVHRINNIFYYSVRRAGSPLAPRPSIVQLQREFINLLMLHVCWGVVKLVGSYFLINLHKYTYQSLHLK